MKLFLLTAKESVDYDEFDAVFVRAKDEKAARELASTVGGKWSNGYIFLDPSASNCEVITSKGKSEIILDSFRAG